MPKAKKVEPSVEGGIPFKYTTFHTIGYLNGKNAAANFARKESQTWWSKRKNEKEYEEWRKKRKLTLAEKEEEEAGPSEPPKRSEIEDAFTLAEEERQREVQNGEPAISVDPSSKVIVIHPGSRWLRIGVASEPLPTTIPNVIARRDGRVDLNGKGKEVEGREVMTGGLDGTNEAAKNGPLSSATNPPPHAAEDVKERMDDDEINDNIAESVANVHVNGVEADGMEQDLPPQAEQVSSFEDKVATIRADLRSRMRVQKLRGTTNGQGLAKAYNETVQPEVVPEHNDPYRVEWTEVGGSREGEKIEKRGYVIGDQALNLADPESLGFRLRWPIYRGTFNTKDYDSQQELLSDIETIWRTVLEDWEGVDMRGLEDYSAILIIPDLYDQHYVREMTHMLLRSFGFRQVCLQQESLCVTFGAGLSSACVVDIGATKTSIACVEEGLVLAETRIVLDFGGDDITRFLLDLLRQSSFPYPEVDLNRLYDFRMMEDLKERICGLHEANQGLNIYDFYDRKPGQATRKFMVRVYEEVILAPMILFHPRIVDFDKKKRAEKQLWAPVDEIIDIGSNAVTNTMRGCTKHLVPATTTPATHVGSVSLAVPQDIPSNRTSSMATSPAMTPMGELQVNPLGEGASMPSVLLPAGATNTDALADPGNAADSKPPTRLPSPSGVAENGIATAASQSVQTAGQPQANAPSAIPSDAEGGQSFFDIVSEASKVPLDVAITESLNCAGSDEKVKKLCSSIIVVGGTALMQGINWAIQTRLKGQLSVRRPSIQDVSIIPPPRELDPRILAWKGVSLLSKLESAGDLWIRAEDWEALGIRALKERSFYF